MWQMTLQKQMILTGLQVLQSFLLKYPSLYVCMYGYAFRRAMRYAAETLHGGRGRVQEV